MSDRLVITDDGKAELLREGATIWASDDDPDFPGGELILNNELRESGIKTTVRYLFRQFILTRRQADDLDVEYPDDVTVIEDMDDADDDEDDDDDELDPAWDDDDDDDNTDE